MCFNNRISNLNLNTKWQVQQKKLKTVRGSYAGLDLSIQTKNLVSTPFKPCNVEQIFALTRTAAALFLNFLVQKAEQNKIEKTQRSHKYTWSGSSLPRSSLLAWPDRSGTAALSSGPARTQKNRLFYLG
jgi:hypothetical protein